MKLYFSTIIIINLFVPAAEGQMMSLPVNTLCQSAYINSLIDTAAYDNQPTNLCRLPANEVSSKWKDAISQIGEINQNLAALLNTNPTELFSDSLNIHLHNSSFAFNGFYDHSENTIILEQYSYPQGFDYEYLNAGIYAHELGHWLAYQVNDQIPSLIKKTKKSFLFSETIADTVAMALTESVQSKQNYIPECLHNRVISNQISYLMPKGYFLRTYKDYAMESCCESSEIESSEPASLYCMINAETPSTHYGPYDDSPFNSQLVYENIELYSEHQIGIPINAFLLSLKNESFDDIFTQLIGVSGSVPATRFSCQVGSDAIFVTSEFGLNNQLQNLKSNLLQQGLSENRWNQLWTHHFLDTALLLDQQDIYQRAEQSAFEWAKANISEEQSCAQELISSEKIKDLS